MPHVVESISAIAPSDDLEAMARKANTIAHIDHIRTGVASKPAAIKRPRSKKFSHRTAKILLKRARGRASSRGAVIQPDRPQPASKRLSMAWMRKVPTAFTESQQKFVYRQHMKALRAAGYPPRDEMPKHWFVELLRRAQESGDLTPSHTSEGARSFIRRVRSGKVDVSAYAEDAD